MTHHDATGLIGQPIKREDDRKLVTGRGRFVDDLNPPGTTHVAFVRSPYAHADIVSVDTSAARTAPGVVAVVTGAELDEWMKPSVIQEPLLPNRPLLRHSLVADRARYSGDAIAAVIAETAAQAADAAELVNVEYHERPAVTTAEAALADDAPIVHDGWENNMAYHLHAGSGDVDAAFPSAPHTVSLRLVLPRVASVYIEPKAVLATWDAFDERMTVWASTQTPHGLRSQISAVLDVPEHHIRVIAPDVGGAFGTKGRHVPDYLFAAAASKKLGRPVKWVEDRSEYFQSPTRRATRSSTSSCRRGRWHDHRHPGPVYVNLGAYNASGHGGRTLIMSGGAYKVPNLVTDIYGVMTNTTPTGPYRGAGRPEAAYMVERLIEEIARVTGIDALELRRRNFVPPDAFPYRAATGVTYDSGDYGRALDVALQRLDLAAERRRVDSLRAEGKLAGIGVAVFVEPSGGGWDSAEVRVSPSGSVTVAVGVSPHGQGTDVAIRQLVADQLGLPIEQVEIRASDTDTTPQGIGTFGSRSFAVGGGAATVAATQVAHKVRSIAGAMLETAADDIELKEAQRASSAPLTGAAVLRVAAAAHAA